MRIKLLSYLCAVAGLLLVSAVESRAGVSWSVSVFEGPLGRSGHWIDRPGYGRCWYPAYVSSDWRPYCEGYWMWTDSGWYWVSNEEWGWATYHYGRWDHDSYYGWVWVPDTEWAPSWVEWREGDEYVGWAPLPPGAYYGPEGYVFAREHPIHDNFFVFVQVGHFAEPIHRRAVIVNNTTIINKTVNITRVTRVNNVVINNGPRVENIQRVSSRKLTEPPPHVAPERPGAAKRDEAIQKNLRSTYGEEPHAPASAEKTGKHEPEVVHGTPTEKSHVESQTTPSQPSPTGNSERRKKDEASPSERQQSERNFVPKPTQPVVSDSVQSKQQRQQQLQQHKEQVIEQKESRQQERESHQQENKDGKQSKGEQGGN